MIPSFPCGAPPTSLRRCGQAGRRSGSVDSVGAAWSWRFDMPRDGRCPATGRVTSPTSPSAGRRFARALDAAGRDPDNFGFAAQLTCGTTAADRREALQIGRRFVEAGANHVILGLPAIAAPDGLAAVVREVGEQLREAANH